MTDFEVGILERLDGLAEEMRAARQDRSAQLREEAKRRHKRTLQWAEHWIKAGDSIRGRILGHFQNNACSF